MNLIYQFQKGDLFVEMQTRFQQILIDAGQKFALFDVKFHFDSGKNLLHGQSKISQGYHLEKNI